MNSSLSQSQKNLLSMLAGIKPEENSNPALTNRPEQLGMARSNLPRLHAMPRVPDLDRAEQEWARACEDFETDELSEMLDQLCEAAERAKEQRKGYHLPAQFAYSLMVWFDGVLSDMESDNLGYSVDYTRYTQLFALAFDYYSALLRVLEAQEAEGG